MTRLWYPAMLTVLCCWCNGTRPSDKFQESGAFVLKTPPVNDSTYEGYNILDDFPANAHSLYDVRLLNFAYQDSVNIMANWYAGGILPGNGNLAPDFSYPQVQNIDLQIPRSYPLQFFLLCKDQRHYCRLLLDSIQVLDEYDVFTADSVKVCAGYFSYTLNRDEYERAF
jgi:hypothetical protein